MRYERDYHGSIPAKSLFLLLMIVFFHSVPLPAGTNLLNLEIQAVGKYDLSNSEFQPYSHHKHDAMQKPSIGFDYIHRLRGKSRDWGYVSIQSRLAYDELRENKIEAQLYNAFLNWKAPWLDLWIGHNKPALGLSSYLDNHAQLLIDNTMTALNFDRDWGVGANYETETIDLKLSLTTGSGMPLYLDETYLVSGRLGVGDLAKGNSTVGVSFAAGEVLHSMGYNVMHGEKAHQTMVGGVDGSMRYLDWETAADLILGSYDEYYAYTGLLRLNHYLFPEDRASIMTQAQFTRLKNVTDQNYAVAMQYKISPALTLRAMYNYRHLTENHTVSAQLFYYRGFIF
ncbi:MAG: hypothetical protein FJ042_04005 [Candidatus Cloacimonetes bacterium]|nr:hypothetical protein [Candidatus Cloacimonadota bacterium]